MLIVSRGKGEVIVIRAGDEVIRVTLIETRGTKSRIGVEAAKHVQIDREEIDQAKRKELESCGNISDGLCSPTSPCVSQSPST